MVAEERAPAGLDRDFITPYIIPKTSGRYSKTINVNNIDQYIPDSNLGRVGI